MANVDPAAILTFLGDYRQQSSPSHEGWSVGASNQYSSTPRQPSPFVYATESEEEAYALPSTLGSVSISDRNTNYTTASQATRSSRHSVMSSSVFSSRSKGSTAQSSRPARNGPHPTFAAQFAQARDPTNPEGSFTLWCEFCALKNCNATFRGDDEYAWIEHHIHHLHNRFPQQVVCWFCDDVPFVSGRTEERYDNFVVRMQHIRWHIFDEHLTRSDMRPDFHVIQHLRKHNLIDKETFNHAMGYDELPATLRLPGEQELSYDPSYNQPQASWDPTQFAAEEKRHRRRNRERDPSKKKKWT